MASRLWEGHDTTICLAHEFTDGARLKYRESMSSSPPVSHQTRRSSGDSGFVYCSSYPLGGRLVNLFCLVSRPFKPSFEIFALQLLCRGWQCRYLLCCPSVRFNKTPPDLLPRHPCAASAAHLFRTCCGVFGRNSVGRISSVCKTYAAKIPIHASKPSSSCPICLHARSEARRYDPSGSDLYSRGATRNPTRSPR
jgi:hypothetical protein